MAISNFTILKMKTKDETFESVPFGINAKERAIAKTRYQMFSMYCKYLIDKNSDGEEIFYIRDIRRYGKISNASANNFFTSLYELGYLNKKYAGNNIFFELKKDSEEKPLILELLPYIKKTLHLNGDSE